MAKVLARAGVASRRRCEMLVFGGRVRVNGQTITHPAARIDPSSDRVEVDGRLVRLEEPRRYIVVHKPRGIVSTCSDPRGRRTVLDLLPAGDRLYPVGRLDAPSEGLMILTNDGDLALVLTHPRYEVPKTYAVTVRGHPTDEALARIESGVDLPDGRSAPAEVSVINVGEDRTRLELVIREGKKRQIRRMMDSLGHPVLRLKRIAIGPIRLGDLAPGAWRPMTGDEIRSLREAGRERGKDEGPQTRITTRPRRKRQ